MHWQNHATGKLVRIAGKNRQTKKGIKPKHS